MKVEHNRKGVSFVERGYYRKAIDEFNKALRLDPEYGLAHNNLGSAYCKLAIEEKPLIEYRHTTSAENDPASVYNEEGVRKAEESVLEEAIEMFEMSVMVDPHFVPALANLGLCYMMTGRLHEASVCFSRYLKSNPDDMVAVHNLRKVNLRRSLYKKAIACFLNAIKTDSQDPKPFSNMSVPLLGLRMINEAERYARMALSLEPRLSNAYSNLGHVEMEKGNWEEAVKCLRKAIRLDPSDVEPLNNLGICLAQMGRYRKALRCLRKASSVDWGNETVERNRRVIKYLFHKKIFGTGVIGQYLGLSGSNVLSNTAFVAV